MPGSKSDLLHCHEKFNKEAATDNMTMDCIILDGAAIISMIKLTGVATFQEYATQNFTSYKKTVAKERKSQHCLGHIHQEFLEVLSAT